MRILVPKRVWVRASAVCFGLALCSCDEQVQVSAPLPSDVLVQVGERSITAEQWQAASGRLGTGATPEQKKQLLDELIRSEVLVVQARKAGYHQRPELLARYDQFVSTEFIQERLQPLLVAASTATADEIAAYYHAHAAKYTSPETFRVGVICLKLNAKATGHHRAQAAQRADAILAEAQQTDEAGFARLAQQHSDDQATRYRGGDAGWICAGSTGAVAAVTAHWPATVLSVADALAAPGDFGPVVETENGLYIVRLLEKRRASRRALAEVSEGIRYLVAREKRAEAERRFYEQLATELRINVNHALLESISLSTNSVSSTPPPRPGG